ncbi:MAG: hypothetical protein HUU22_02340 [Phycisphaerae bacterium]|nr:hypothetical protein [Phycisphaerae bacterium]NUQ44853.1 hypothetical protein [Phycisphaerae bacterium]
MVKTINITADVPPIREMRITLPADGPVGPTDLVVVVISRKQEGSSTLGQLLQSIYFGMWRNRTDIADSCEFAAKLRTNAWHHTE